MIAVLCVLNPITVDAFQAGHPEELLTAALASVPSLLQAQETPTGKGCTTRLYAYDADSNRTAATTRGAVEGGACAESGGLTQTTALDAGDRLYGGGIAYNAFGDITELRVTDHRGVVDAVDVE